MKPDPTEFYTLCAAGTTSGPVNPKAIEEAEARLGIVFPDEYRNFLARFGALVGAVEIWGLFTKEGGRPFWQDVVDVNLRLRSWTQAGTERPGFFAMSEDGMGVYFFLNANAAPETEIWEIGSGVERKVSDNLAQFFVNLSTAVPSSPQP